MEYPSFKGGTEIDKKNAAYDSYIRVKFKGNRNPMDLSTGMEHPVFKEDRKIDNYFLLPVIVIPG